MQEHIIAHLLQSILTNQVDLAVSKSVIDLRRSCPAWLQSWCLRWGFTGQHISILTLMAYAESESSSILYDFLGHPLEPSKPTSTANMVLYLPCTLDEIES